MYACVCVYGIVCVCVCKVWYGVVWCGSVWLNTGKMNKLTIGCKIVNILLDSSSLLGMVWYGMV